MVSHLPQSWCPSCRQPLNAAGSVPAPDWEAGRQHPVEGDLTICAGCDAVLQFSAGMQLRQVTETEIAELPVDERLAIGRAQSFTRRARGATS